MNALDKLLETMLRHPGEAVAGYKAAANLLANLRATGIPARDVVRQLASAIAMFHHDGTDELRAFIQEDVRQLLLAIYADRPCSRCQVVGVGDVQK